MASYNRVVFSGSSNTLSVPFPYIDKSHVVISVDYVVLSPSQYTWLSAGQVQITAGPPAAGAIGLAQRNTPTTPISVFSAGNLDVTDLNVASRQPLYLAEEAKDLGSITDFLLASVPFTVAARPESSSLSDRFSSVIDLGSDFKVTTDNTGDNTAKINAAIAKASTEATYPTKIVVPKGLIVVDASAMNVITKPLYIEGLGMETSHLMVKGAGNFLKFHGDAGNGRLAAPIIRDLHINSLNQTAAANDADGTPTGFAIDMSFCQESIFENVRLADVWNSINIRQCGNVRMGNIFTTGLRGNYGLYAFGNNLTRNGAPDTTQVIDINGTFQVESKYAGVPGSFDAGIGIVIDGFVNTFTADVIRLLNIGCGMKVQNTPGVSANLLPLAITIRDLEIEGTAVEALILTACQYVMLHYVALANSALSNVVTIDAAAHDVIFGGGYINGGGKAGVGILGGNRITFKDIAMWFNSRLTSGAYPGLLISGGDNIKVQGGLLGKNLQIPTYTERQGFGVQMVNNSASHVLLQGVDLRGNLSGTTAGTPMTIDSNCILA